MAKLHQHSCPSPAVNVFANLEQEDTNFREISMLSMGLRCLRSNNTIHFELYPWCMHPSAHIINNSAATLQKGTCSFWRFKSVATRPLIRQPVRANDNGNPKCISYDTLVMDEIPTQRANDGENIPMPWYCHDAYILGTAKWHHNNHDKLIQRLPNQNHRFI